jgi:hypothetical protein
MAGAVLERVLANEAIEVVHHLTGHFGWAPRTGTVGEALDALASKAMDPFAQRGIGKVQGVRDGLEALSCHNVAHRLGTPEHTDLLRLL